MERGPAASPASGARRMSPPGRDSCRTGYPKAVATRGAGPLTVRAHRSGLGRHGEPEAREVVGRPRVLARGGSVQVGDLGRRKVVTVLRCPGVEISASNAFMALGSGGRQADDDPDLSWSTGSSRRGERRRWGRRPAPPVPSERERPPAATGVGARNAVGQEVSANTRTIRSAAGTVPRRRRAGARRRRPAVHNENMRRPVLPLSPPKSSEAGLARRAMRRSSLRAYMDLPVWHGLEPTVSSFDPWTIALVLVLLYAVVVFVLYRLGRLGGDHALSLFGPALMIKTRRGRDTLDRIGRFRAVLDRRERPRDPPRGARDGHDRRRSSSSTPSCVSQVPGERRPVPAGGARDPGDQPDHPDRLRPHRAHRRRRAPRARPRRGRPLPEHRGEEPRHPLARHPRRRVRRAGRRGDAQGAAPARATASRPRACSRTSSSRSCSSCSSRACSTPASSRTRTGSGSRAVVAGDARGEREPRARRHHRRDQRHRDHDQHRAPRPARRDACRTRRSRSRTTARASTRSSTKSITPRLGCHVTPTTRPTRTGASSACRRCSSPLPS